MEWWEEEEEEEEEEGEEVGLAASNEVILKAVDFILVESVQFGSICFRFLSP